MTNDLKELLKHYGVLTVTLNQLLRERPGATHESLEEYYKELGVPLPGEPILVVRISKDGEPHFLKEGQHDVRLNNEEGEKAGIVTVWELLEDEYWFFQAFRPRITPDDCIEWEEKQLIRFTGGYGSVFGDGTQVECDLCQACVEALIGTFCRRVTPVSPAAPNRADGQS